MPSSILTIPAKVLSFFLAFVFVMSGLAKIAPWHPFHPVMLKEAPNWLAALRLSVFGVSADALRLGIGISELSLGLLVLVTPAAGYGLAAIMGGALATHYIMEGNNITPDMIPAAVLSVVLGVHAVLHGAIKAARKAELQAQAVAKDD